jgi:hypothetical protein
MDTPLELDIKYYLQVEQKVRRMEQDRYIRYFNAPWGYINTEHGGVNDELPPGYGQAYIDAMSGVKRDPTTGHVQHQKDKAYSWGRGIMGTRKRIRNAQLRRRSMGQCGT